MKGLYEEPTLEVIRFDTVDIITSSPGAGNDVVGGDGDDDDDDDGP